MTKQRLVFVLVLAATIASAGCAAGRAYRSGQDAARAGDWDTAVSHYQRAVQGSPDNAVYKIALQRAMQSAAQEHISRANQLEQKDQLDAALIEYRKAIEMDATNRLAAARVAELERTIRERIEATRPRPRIDTLREQARQGPPPLLGLRERLRNLNFNNSSVRDILSIIGSSAGIRITYDQAYQDKAYSIELEDVTVEEALQQIMSANQLFYKVINPKTIIVINDRADKRQQYDEMVVRVFYVSHADAQELSQTVTTIMRVPQMPVAPVIMANKTANTITVRATAQVADIIERIIRSNDKPRAEVVIDVQILEVSRERAKTYGLDLGSYSASLAFSPESAPGTDAKPFNLNTISQGVSTADFYLAVPSAVVRFLESDSNTKVLAKPNLRGAEGQKLSLNLGEDVPIPSTTFTPLAGTTGPGTSPLTSFGYRTIGIIVEMTPRVTYDGDIILELTLENSARGQDSNIAGQNLPSFFSRKVTTKLRLRDGESNLLAGLLREDERRSLKGFPGVMRLPIVRQLFSANDSNIKQTDIVMLLTPRIIRTHDLRAQDLSPIYIGTQSNMSLTGPPATIGGPVEPDPSAAAAPAPASPDAAPGTITVPGTPTSPSAAPTAPPSPATPQPNTQPPAAPVLPTGSTQRPVVPPGSSPIPGMVPAPTTPTPAPSNITVFSPPPEPPAVPPAAAPPAAAPAPGAPAPPAAIAPARVTLSAPGEMRVGSGPYTIPISIAAATRVSTLTLSITYNPALIRVRNVQEGTFMRQGGAAPAFSSQIDEKSGRIDIVITRPGDKTGASTAGLLAALLVEPLAAGTGTLSVSGSASIPGGAAAALQFLPAGITVR